MRTYLSAWFILACVALLFVCQPWRPAYAGGGADKLVASLRKKIRAKPESLAAALRTYNSVEKKKQIDRWSRYLLHAGLLEELRGLEHEGLATTTRSLLKRSGKTNFPAQVLLIKAMISAKFPAERTERVALLVETIRKPRNPRLDTWAIRMLAESRWPEAIDALIGLLEEEEKAGRFFEALFHTLKSELYRVLGGEVAQVGSQKIRATWEASGKKVPETPEYTGRASGRTAAFFGDRVVPASVFCVDASGSMADEIRLRSKADGTTSVKPPGKIDTTPKEPKLTIVQRELHSAFKGIHPSWTFNVASYSDAPRFWRGAKRGGGAKLAGATEKSVQAALEFAQKLTAEGATNIHDTLVVALAIPGVDTIYLLSDGSPTVGGGMRDISESVAAMNYLHGVRIITYGFREEDRFRPRRGRRRRPPRHERFMKRLAVENWGWYRRLN